MDEPELERLVERCRAGGPGAFDELLGWLVPQVHRLLRGLTRDPEAAEDLTQEVAEAVFTKLHQYRPGTRFRAWAMTVATNRWRDWLRRRPATDPGATQQLTAPSPEEACEASDEGRRLWQAVRTLGEDERSVVCLRHLAGLPFKDVADALGRPLGTVLSLHHRALDRLARRVREATS